MALEAADWITELDPTNPPGTDLKKQGDDHLRMTKQVLRNTFPNAAKAFYFPETEAKDADFAVAASDMNKTFLIDTTTAAVNATLPDLAIGDAGWECFFLKTNTGTNPYFIVPDSGTIQSGDQAGLAKARRCIPGERSKAFWTGSAWIAERVVRVPIGTVLDCPRTLPVGYEYAAGQTLTSALANYPDFYKANGDSGVVTDRRGRVAFGRDNMTTAAGRLGNTGSGITPADGEDTVGTTFGADATTLVHANLPNVTFPKTLAVSDPGHSHGVSDPGHFHSSAGIGVGPSGAFGITGGIIGIQSQGLNNSTDTKGTGISINVAGTGVSIVGNTQSGGTDTPFSRLPPGIITNFMVVVE